MRAKTDWLPTFQTKRARCRPCCVSFFLCFIFLAAAAQKLSSPTYRSGEMFEYYLYVDSRFTAFGKFIGIDPSVPDAVQKTIALFRSPFLKLVDNELELPA